MNILFLFPVLLLLSFEYNLMMQVKKVDQEYHETVNRVMNTLNAMPEVVSANSPLHQLLLSLKAGIFSLYTTYYLPCSAMEFIFQK